MHGKVKSYVYLFAFLILLWLLLTSSLNFEEVIIGILICSILTLSLGSYYFKLGLPPLSVKRFAFFIAYVGTLLWGVIKANLDVAYRVLHPKMPIKPGIVIIKTGLKQNIAKMILANSITLTPGTFTLDVSGNRLLIHWINVKTENVNEASKIIGRRFEKYLSVVFA